MRINPRDMEKMARRLGMQAEPVEAEEVIIRTPSGDIVIREPNVTKVNMMGQETWQVMGTAETMPKDKFSPEDIRLVMDKTGATEKEAKEALEKAGDIAEAILDLEDKKGK